MVKKMEMEDRLFDVWATPKSTILECKMLTGVPFFALLRQI